MAIVVQRKKIQEDLVDENGKVLGIISYNPEDTSTYKKLSNILQDLLEISDEVKKISNFPKIPEKEINDMEIFEKYRDNFNKMDQSLNLCDEKIENIKKSIDDIFGKGTSQIVMDNSNDIDLLKPLIEGVLPNFKKSRDNKTKKYLDDLETLDVME